MQLDNGTFPADLEMKDKDHLVHFCHGAPGAIPMLIEAHRMFKDQIYMDALIKAGECTWNLGLLLKGNGLCHGISGNAYFLHSIWRYT